MDMNRLIQPVSETRPCGTDLEYDPEFIALEREMAGKPEVQIGATVTPAEEPDWPQVAALAEALLGRTKDLRVAAALARALLRTAGVGGLRDGLWLIAELIERYWPDLQPPLDAEDGDDPTMRLSALAPLRDAGTFIRDLRAVPLVNTAGGRLTVRQILIATGKLAETPDPSALSKGQVEQMLQEAFDAEPALGPLLSAAHEQCQRLQRALDEAVGAHRSLDLEPLNTLLKHLAGFYRAPAASPVPAGETEQGADASAAGSPAPAGGPLRNRDDAMRLLDQVCEYMDRYEPGHPAPLFIRRAQRLMSKSFVEIIRDLAPDSLNRIQELTGDK